MKIPFPLPAALCLLVLIGPAGAEEASVPPTPTPAPRRIVREVAAPLIPGPVATPALAEGGKLTRFDLDFPGGTPAQLAAAISKAMGKNLNLVIPAEQADAEIMPIKLDNVTVREVFTAIALASEHQEAFSNGAGPGEARNYQINTVRMTFVPGSPEGSPYSDETVWAFRYDRPSKNLLAAIYAGQPVPPPICRYFQLASYLENYSIEDITTAIQTGWKMAKVEPMPQLSFHRETSLLIAVGPEASVQLIPDVLAQLRRDRTGAVKKIVELQRKLDDDIASNQGRKSNEIREQISQVAREQNANETIENPNSVYGIKPPR